MKQIKRIYVDLVCQSEIRNRKSLAKSPAAPANAAHVAAAGALFYAVGKRLLAGSLSCLASLEKIRVALLCIRPACSILAVFPVIRSTVGLISPVIIPIIAENRSAAKHTEYMRHQGKFAVPFPERVAIGIGTPLAIPRITDILVAGRLRRVGDVAIGRFGGQRHSCLLYTSPSPRDPE